MSLKDLAALYEHHAEAGRFHDAHAVAERIHAADAGSIDGLVYMADACWALRQTHLAREYIEKAAAAGANGLRFHKIRSKTLRGQGNLNAAVDHATKARNLAPDDVEAVLGLAVATFLAGSQKDALAVIDASPGRVARSRDTVRARALIATFFHPEQLDLSLFDKPTGPVTLATRPLVVDHPFILQDIELTNHCPMKCVMCPRTENMTRALGHMTFDTFQRIVDEWADIDPTFGGAKTVWLHHYGESLVHPEFDRFIKYAPSKGMPAGLSINPIMLTRPLAERLLLAEPHTLWIALDGHDNETFQAIRGIPNAYEKSKANALQFAQMKAERKSDTHLQVIMINFPDNQKSIAEVTDFWAKVEGVDKFQPKPFTTWDGSVEHINKLNHRPENMKARRACNFAWSALSVTYTGDVVACCYDYDGKYVLGNVHQISLAEIWNGPRMRHLRASLVSRFVPNKMCQNCENLCSV
jgi:radical SAM protein with 4Fe4S-binding SPASM domain